MARRLAVRLVPIEDWNAMDLILIGPGRAGLAVSFASSVAGHRIVGVLARDPEAASRGARLLESSVLSWDEPLPPADLVVVSVRDDAISEVAGRLSGKAASVGGAVHLSGLTSAGALSPLGTIPVGSFHPLQTLPSPEAGAGRIAGAWIAITTDDDLLADRLFAWAASLDARPFELDDDAKPLYHAAAAAAANYPLAALSMSRRLFEAAGVPPEVAAPLVRAVVDNALTMGPEAALTGPAARGDSGTVRAQLQAVRNATPELAEDFAAFARAAARVAGTLGVIEEALE